MRQLGRSPFAMWQQLSGRHGERETRRAGAAGELTGATRPGRSVTRTLERHPHLTNAVLRDAGNPEERASSGIHITVDDVEIWRPKPVPRPPSRCWSTRRSRW